MLLVCVVISLDAFVYKLLVSFVLMRKNSVKLNRNDDSEEKRNLYDVTYFNSGKIPIGDTAAAHFLPNRLVVFMEIWLYPSVEDFL